MIHVLDKVYLLKAGVPLLLANDLAEDKAVVNPLVTATSCVDHSLNPVGKESPDLYPSCAVTRPMTKKAMLTENSSCVDLTDSKREIHISVFGYHIYQARPETAEENQGILLHIFSVFMLQIIGFNA